MEAIGIHTELDIGRNLEGEIYVTIRQKNNRTVRERRGDHHSQRVRIRGNDRSLSIREILRDRGTKCHQTGGGE